jgi:hypothetical protein
MTPALVHGLHTAHHRHQAQPLHHQQCTATTPKIISTAAHNHYHYWCGCAHPPPLHRLITPLACGALHFSHLEMPRHHLPYTDQRE